jgi:energy-coupling factor transporter ATP-binding protein EcfA2
VPKQESNASLSRLMIGSEPPALARRVQQAGAVVMEVRGLRLARADQYGVDLQGVSLHLRAGEVLGIAGVSGNGQQELLRALSGEDRRAPPGTVLIDGVDVSAAGPAARRAQGLHFVPEERLGRGAVPPMSLADNLLLTREEAVQSQRWMGGWIDTALLRSQANSIIDRFKVKAHGSTATFDRRNWLMYRQPLADWFGHLVGRSIADLVAARTRVPPKVVVLDADALNAVAADPQLMTQLRARAKRSLATVLTPHPLEAARLLGCDIAAVQANRLSSACALTDLTGCVVVLKGSGSITAAPGRVPHLNGTGNGSLASGGTGDVLAGWLGGLLAQAGPVSAGDAQTLAFVTALQAVADHGAAAEPLQQGALPASELIGRLQHDLRYGRSMR